MPPSTAKGSSLPRNLLAALALSAALLASVLSPPPASSFRFDRPRLLARLPLPRFNASLVQLKSVYGSLRSDVTASGKARLGNGSLVTSDEWTGLLAEPLRDTIDYVLARQDEAGFPFGSTRATFFARNNALTNLFADAMREIEAQLPTRITPLNGWTLWMRAMKEAGSVDTSVGWHAHPDSGIYVHLFGNKTFHYIDASAWKPLAEDGRLGLTWDDHFPLVFADGKDIDRLAASGAVQVRQIPLLPGDVLFQPAWAMHRLTYHPSPVAGDGPGHFASLRLGFVFVKTLLEEPWLFAKAIPRYLDVGAKVAWQKLLG